MPKRHVYRDEPEPGLKRLCRKCGIPQTVEWMGREQGWKFRCPQCARVTSWMPRASTRALLFALLPSLWLWGRMS